MMSQETLIQVFLAVPMPTNESDIEDNLNIDFRANLYQTIDNLCSISIQFDLLEWGECTPEISLADNKKRIEIKKIFPLKLFHKFEHYEILEVSCIIPFSEEQIEDDPPNFPAGAVARYLIGKYFCKKIFDLIIISNLCRIGSIGVANSVVFIDNVYAPNLDIPSIDTYFLECSVEYSKKIGWPKFKNINIAEAWEWLNGYNYFSNDFNKDPIERALCAFSNLFDNDVMNNPMLLIWALVGIEAIYVKGKSGLIEQVKEKSQIFLGKYATYKKKINQMYNFRSRFIHGDLNFPRSFFMEDAIAEYKKYNAELYESIDLAIAILSASIQELIVRNWNGIVFQYTPIEPTD
ncbi:hypothetical protein [uncultured Desulfobacter sp.]|uniref:hypothetical protein n=1 Tax=uncultured Desulfobacter sp. TaxID=240139 RepID=UPI0029F51B4D|nr:hypothetical protein [uncultured Desulfobacter sp.]